MKNMFLGIMTVFSVLLISCNSNSELVTTETKKVDSLISLVDSAEAIINDINSDTDVLKIVKQIKEGVKPASTDSLSSEFGAFMNVKKFFVKKFKNKIGEVSSNIKYTKNQLANLKHDIPILIKQGEIKKVKKYISDEAKATSIIVDKTNELKQTVERNKKAFFELKEKSE
jgi:hypothetical protein